MSATFCTLVQPLAGESLLSFVLRVAEANGASHGLRSVTQAIDPDANADRPFWYLSDQLGRLSLLTGIAEAVLASMAYVRPRTGSQPGSAKVKAFGTKIRPALLMKSPARVCVSCLQETGTVSQLCDLKLYTCCHIHRHGLRDTCGNCNSRISWGRHRINQCSACGSLLSDSPAPAATRDQIEFAQAVADACGAPHSSQLRSRLWNCIPYPGHLALETIVDMTSFLGGLLTRNAPYTVTEFLDRPVEQIHSDIGTVSKLMFQNWPGGLFELIDRHTDLTLPADASPQKRFKHFYIATTPRKTLNHLWLRDHFVTYIADRYPLIAAQSSKRSSAMRKASEMAGFLSLNAAARALGTKAELLHCIGAEDGCLVSAGASGTKTTRIHERDLPKLADRLAKLRRFNTSADRQSQFAVRENDRRLSDEKIGKLLGVSSESVLRMRQSGVFGPRTLNSRGKAQLPGVSKNDVTRLLQELAANARAGQSGIGLLDALRGRLRTRAISLTDCLRWIQNGDVVPSRAQERGGGLNQILLSEDNIARMGEMAANRAKPITVRSAKC